MKKVHETCISMKFWRLRNYFLYDQERTKKKENKDKIKGRADDIETSNTSSFSLKYLRWRGLMNDLVMIASAMCPMSPCYKGKETEQVYKARTLPKWIEAGIVVTIPRCHSLHDLMRKLSLTQRVICHISQNYKERITKWKKKWYLTLMKMSMASSIYLKQSLRVCSEFCGSKSATILRWWAMSMSIMAVLCCVNNKWMIMSWQ